MKEDMRARETSPMLLGGKESVKEEIKAGCVDQI